MHSSTPKDLLQLTSYHYHLPQELIAQTPACPRDQARLLLVNKQSGNFSEIKFADVLDFLQPDDQLILNDTKVIPARLLGKREQFTSQLAEGKTEILLIKRLSEDTWEALAKPGKKLKPGSKIYFNTEFTAQVLQTTSQGTKILRFEWQGDFEELLQIYGELPLPPYIQTASKQDHAQNYQTVFAAHPGACAAPTAGLHFTSDLLQKLNAKGVKQNTLTLHVGPGTFKPVKAADIRLHEMHTESLIIPEQTAEQLNKRDKAKKCICIGTTSCRAVETASNETGVLQPGYFDTNIFIYPGYQFKFTSALLTNFHLPGSSLLMLVAAFTGYELMIEAYQKAIKERFRFYSYGDAMLIY